MSTGPSEHPGGPTAEVYVGQEPQSQDRHRDVAAFEVHEAGLRRSQAWASLAELYAGRVAALEKDPRERARVLLKQGALLDRQLGRPAAAADAYQEAAQLAPEDPTPLRQLRALHRARGNHAMVLQLADAELARLGDATARAALLEETADIWENELSDAEQARVLRLRAAEERGESAPAPGAADPEATAQPDSPAASNQGPLTQRAWLAAARGRSAEALAILREALERDPEDVESIDMLITILDGSERHAESAQWLERRAALAGLETRPAVLMRLAGVREELGDLAAARAAYEQAMEIEPRTAGLRVALLRLYLLTEAWTPLRAFLERWSQEGTTRERVDAFVSLGELLQTHLDDPEAAAESFRQALALQPDESRAQDALSALESVASPDVAPASEAQSEADADTHEVDERQRALRIRGVLQRKLESLESGEGEPGTEVIELRLRIAELHSESLDDPVGAIESIEPLLAFEAGTDAAAETLAKLYEHTERLDALSRLAEQMASREAGPDSVRWLRRSAEAARRSGRSDVAIAALLRILEESPGDAETEQVLQGLYRGRGDARPLVELLRRTLGRADVGREREIHIELATLLEDSLGDAAGALVHLARAIELEPQDFQLLERGLALAGRVGGDLTQLDLLDRIAESSEDPILHARLYARRATHLADCLGWNEEARDAWQRARELDPECAEAYARLGVGPTASAEA